MLFGAISNSAYRVPLYGPGAGLEGGVPLPHVIFDDRPGWWSGDSFNLWRSAKNVKFLIEILPWKYCIFDAPFNWDFKGVLCFTGSGIELQKKNWIWNVCVINHEYVVLHHNLNKYRAIDLIFATGNISLVYGLLIGRVWNFSNLYDIMSKNGIFYSSGSTSKKFEIAVL